ncbi:MAG TPA: DMT family transporter [Vicinamibacterales bacterium]|nr:DMT family transporter [Vicinamibacterales bacterium]
MNVVSFVNVVPSSAAAIAIASAVLYGAADFVGGLTARRASTLAVVFVSQFAGALTLLLFLPLLPHADPSRVDLQWGVVAGVAGGVGVALLYEALAIGTMAAVAPTTAVCAVAIPVAVAVIVGERPSAVTWIGMVVALVAIVLVSRESSPADPAAPRRQPGRALMLAIASGVVIGVFYLALARTSAGAGMWPLLAARGASALFFLALALSGGHGRLRLPLAVLPMAAGCGVIDMLANALYLVATRGGPFSVIVTLVSLYPASTVLLARLVLHERLGRVQVAGVVACLVAIVLIVGG